MEDMIRTIKSNSHRYVIDEDSIPKVTSDGEPHEIMTMVAAFSGIIAAVIVLVILIMLIGCRHSSRHLPQLQQDPITNKHSMLIIPIFGKSSKIDQGAPELMSVSTISGNLGHDNPGQDTMTELNGPSVTAINLPEILTARC